MAHLIKGAFAVGILILAAALFTPSLMAATQEDATDTLALNNGTSEDLTERLSIAVTETNDNTAPTPDNATVEITDNASLSTNSTTIGEGNESLLQLSGDNVTVGMENATAERARFNVSYPPMFGWDSGARTFFEESGTILVGLAAAVILGSTVVMFGRD